MTYGECREVGTAVIGEIGIPPCRGAPGFEPRTRWLRGSPGAKPQTLVKGRPGVRLELVVTFEAGQKHLYVVTLHRVD
jgi:hypothetical protein